MLDVAAFQPHPGTQHSSKATKALSWAHRDSARGASLLERQHPPAKSQSRHSWRGLTCRVRGVFKLRCRTSHEVQSPVSIHPQIQRRVVRIRVAERGRVETLGAFRIERLPIEPIE